MEISEAIKVGLRKKNYSQTQLAKIMNVDHSSVNRWVQGKSLPPADKLVKVAKELDIIGEIFELNQEGPEVTDLGPSENRKKTDKYQKISEIENRLEKLERKVDAGEDKSRPKVLVVEDDYRAYQVVSEIIYSSTEFICRRAHDATEALIELETKNHISLIILDLLLPDMDGIELLKKIKGNESWSKIPVIVVSGADAKKINEARSCGVFTVIEKPIRYVDLVEAVNMINPSWPVYQSALAEA